MTAAIILSSNRIVRTLARHAHVSLSKRGTMDAMPSTQATLLYDGTCGFCSNTVQFILRHERGRRTLRFATLQGPLGEELRAKHPRLVSTDSVIWYEPATAERRERVLVRSAAGLAVGRYLGGIWRLMAWVSWCVPRFIRDAAYNMVARNRHRLVKNASCLLPTPEQRARFIG